MKIRRIYDTLTIISDVAIFVLDIFYHESNFSASYPNFDMTYKGFHRHSWSLETIINCYKSQMICIKRIAFSLLKGINILFYLALIHNANSCVIYYSIDVHWICLMYANERKTRARAYSFLELEQQLKYKKNVII